MRHLPRVLVALVLLTLPAVARAESITARDLIELARAGLSDDVLVAMVESDVTIFKLTAAEVIDLKRQGLSERVLVAMIRTAQPKPVAPLVPAEEATQVAAPSPVVLNQNITQHVEVPVQQTHYVDRAVPVYVPVAVAPLRVREPEPPVYWGFNGQRRPDAWAETKTETKPVPAPSPTVPAPPPVIKK